MLKRRFLISLFLIITNVNAFPQNKGLIKTLIEMMIMMHSYSIKISANYKIRAVKSPNEAISNIIGNFDAFLSVINPIQRWPLISQL